MSVSVSPLPATAGRSTATVSVALGSVASTPAAAGAGRSVNGPILGGSYRLVVQGSWSQGASFEAGDEFFVTLAGSSVDSPDVVVSVYFTSQQ